MNKYVKAYHFFTKNRNKIDTQSRADAYIRKKSKKPKNPKYQKTQKNNWAGF
jgi:hypothetical protein